MKHCVRECDTMLILMRFVRKFMKKLTGFVFPLLARMRYHVLVDALCAQFHEQINRFSVFLTCANAV